MDEKHRLAEIKTDDVGGVEGRRRAESTPHVDEGSRAAETLTRQPLARSKGFTELSTHPDSFREHARAPRRDEPQVQPKGTT